MDVRSGYLGREYYARYFRQSITRVYHLVTALRRFGMESGSLLEIKVLFSGHFPGRYRSLDTELPRLTVTENSPVLLRLLCR